MYKDACDNSVSPKFDRCLLESNFQTATLKSPLKIHYDTHLNFDKDLRASQNSLNCKTFVVASEGDRSVRMRTYTGSSNSEDVFDGYIWQAASATSAVPLFFEPCVIDGKQYSSGVSSPSVDAVEEAELIWPNCEIGCFLSVG